ncbi:hypothetical protein AB0M05_43880 [Streptomyces violaceusniger]|uniref:hypothetical protein n=1 Tax=Streptomyces violaceusniger TaxID=68280 RepID=UPI00341B64CE
MKDALLSLYVSGQTYLAEGDPPPGTGKVPSPKKEAPPGLANAVDTVLGILAWAGTAAGVAGILITGVMMSVSVKRGEGSEHLSRLGMVLGGCVLVAAAGPIVQFFFLANPDGGGGGGQ